MTRLCQEWGRKNNVEVQIDYITSVGFKGIVTAAAEAQAGAGHDIFAHPTWQVSIHRHVLEPMDDVMAALEKENGAVDEVVRYLAKGTLVGVRLQPDRLTAVGLDLSAAGAASDAPGSHPPAHGARHPGFDPEQPGLSAGTKFTNGDAPSVTLREKAHE
jgi:hypothetical protein